ncbi:type IVB secretion system protein DotG/IcmE [Legionella drozanskii]|uniref:Protein IcmE (DotG) n=1 Tax=Legionella drozanskii LLAP-1 TaxID=1212489 RepID=A0A0W0SRL0_9GAMM|nr:type IVB secretion system protein DotG/IcmE [Legionella drozanskii]KTC85950.1 protein IcmE (DotG) [Legionella drozanskii LLAP-1]
MAGRKENLKSLFTNTRTRVIIVFTAILLITAVVIGFFKLKVSNEIGNVSSNVSNAPGIQSIPGALNPTVQYAKLQQAQNVDQATSALKTGGSAIPTIIRTQELGAGVQPIDQPPNGQGGVGFATLAREDEAGTQRNSWIQSLQNSSCSKAEVANVVSQGAKLTDLKAGCTCTQLKDNGYQISDLQQICSCKELRASGFNARQLKDAGFTAGRLRLCGFDACELRNAGFTAQQMKDGGFSDGELKGAGFSDDDIAKASGLPNGISEADVRKADCQVDALKRLRASGVSAAAIRRINGCSAAQLKAAGYSPADLRNAGFSAADLKNAGFTPAELRQAGYTARDLLNAGFSPDDLANAGYTPGEISSAESELPPGISPADIKSAGCDVEALKKERLAGVSARLIKQYAGCSAKALKDAGFTDADLANAGFTPEQIRAASLSDDAIRASDCDPNKLKVLFAQGVSAAKIRSLNGCNAAQLKAAGYDAKQLAEAGFTPQQLLAAGYTPDQVRGALTDDAIRADDCDPAKLKQLFNLGVSAKRIRDLNGCSAAALKNAGYGAKALSDAGFTPKELLDAGFSPDQLRQAGVGGAAVIAAGRTADCSVASLQAARAAGVSATTIKQTLGCSAAAMKAAGYTAKELRDAGFTAGELKNAGFSAADLKNAGFSAKELRDAGFSAADLKNAGFSAKDLKDAGFDATALRQAGYPAKDLANAGYSAADLKNAGYSDADIKNAGLTTEVAGLGGANIPGAAPSNVSPIPSLPGLPGQTPNAAVTAQAANAKKLQDILRKQNQQLADQKYQQKIQQRTSQMLGTANQSLSAWQKVTTQTYVAGNEDKKDSSMTGIAKGRSLIAQGPEAEGDNAPLRPQGALIKTGDVLFAVLDTSVNSDEPGPILATIVSGKLKGAKLIGSFNLPTNAEKMVISFNTMSVPGAPKTTSISAYAIDPNTARTAISSNTNHHYLLRYGSLFASSFLEGFGNAFQSANTTVTIGGTGGGQNITVQNGIGRSALQNAVIGLATLGKAWGQVAQQQFSTPTTVEVYSGTALGILFTQDVTSL